jgi:hypothetical protein
MAKAFTNVTSLGETALGLLNTLLGAPATGTSLDTFVTGELRDKCRQARVSASIAMRAAAQAAIRLRYPPGSPKPDQWLNELRGLVEEVRGKTVAAWVAFPTTEKALRNLSSQMRQFVPIGLVGGGRPVG